MKRRIALGLPLLFLLEASIGATPVPAAPSTLALIQPPQLVLGGDTYYTYARFREPLQWAGKVSPRIDTEWFRCDIAQTAEINGTTKSCTSVGKRENDRVVSYMISKEDQGKYIAMRFTATLGTDSLTYLTTLNNPVPDYFKQPIQENFPSLSVKQPNISTTPYEPGIAALGSTLVVSPPTWKTKGVSVSYSWYICSFAGIEMTTLPPGCTKLDESSNQKEYLISSKAITQDKKSVLVGGMFFRVGVTGSVPFNDKRISPAITLFSASTNKIALNLPALNNSSPPLISVKIPDKSTDPSLKLSGARVGHQLTYTTGTWTTDSPVTTYVTYLRCDYPIASLINSLPAPCVEISKEFDGLKSNLSPLIVEADRGKYISARFRSENAAGSVSVFVPSLQVSTETFSRLEASKAPTASIGTEFASAISIDPGSWKGTNPSFSYAWYACPSKVAPKSGNPYGSVNGVFAIELKGCNSFSSLQSTTIPESAIGKFVVATFRAENAISAIAFIVASSNSTITGKKPAIANLPQITSKLISGKSVISILVEPIWMSAVNTFTESALVLCGKPYESGLTILPADCMTKFGQLTSEDEGYFVAVLFSAKNSSGTSYVMSNTAGLVNNVPQTLGDKFIFQIVSNSPQYKVGSTLSLRQAAINSKPLPNKFVYTWYRCSQKPPTASLEVPTSCKIVSKQSSATYVTTKADANNYMGAVVTAQSLAISQWKFFGITTLINP